MKQVLIKQGGVVVQEVPAPVVEAGTVLVRVRSSCISVGTEMSGVKTSSLPLWKRALKSPNDVKKVIDRVKSHGLAETKRLVQQKLDTAYPLGYSASGDVVAVGDGVTDIVIGDHVACAGSQSAHHAEMICVPRNLVVRVPEGVSPEQASTVTLGAIAMQGVRRAEPTIGETFVVIGLGILGQITQQILGANGVRVIGVDLDPARVESARALGMDFGIVSAVDDLVAQAYRLTDGYGADGVIVTAATSSSDILANAFQACRRKGRVVLVGDVGMDIDRADIYAKELDFRISTSYGPGRYDRAYEEQGLDYPLPYVRWTENRNMQAYLHLLAEGAVDVQSLIEGAFPVEDAPQAYEALKNDEKRPLALLLSYKDNGDDVQRSVINTKVAPSSDPDGAIRVAVVGAGGFATGTLMPIMKSLGAQYKLSTVVTRQGHNAVNVARQFDVGEATTDFDAVLKNPNIDMVLIATRHHLHGPMVLAALQAGKHVMVEKPLCLNHEELERIEDFYAHVGADGGPLLMCGFNRRFSPYAEATKAAVKNRVGPMMINYRVNAGYIPPDHWVHGAEGGGRNIGEACHFYDLFTALTESRLTNVTAQAARPNTGHYGRTDNFVATASFEDGSVATLTYTSMGAAGHPKERMDVYVDGAIISTEDYLSMTVVGGSAKPISTRTMEKGHREELMAFAQAVRDGGEWPIPLWQQVQATKMSLDVERQIVD